MANRSPHRGQYRPRSTRRPARPSRSVIESDLDDDVSHWSARFARAKSVSPPLQISVEDESATVHWRITQRDSCTRTCSQFGYCELAERKSHSLVVCTKRATLGVVGRTCNIDETELNETELSDARLANADDRTEEWPNVDGSPTVNRRQPLGPWPASTVTNLEDVRHLSSFLEWNDEGILRKGPIQLAHDEPSRTIGT
jgi:hypothetical protein